MAKKLKKRKKLTRRARQGSGAAQGAPPAVDASTASGRPTEPAPATANAAQANPAPSPAAPTPAAAASAPSSAGSGSATSTVGFRATTKRGPDGIDSKLAASEYPAVRKDLRKLGLTVTFFVAVLAGLTVLGNSTSVISDLGSELFKLWR